MKSLNKTIIRSVLAIFITALCLPAYPAFSTPPPRDYVSYRGDVNGDFIVSLLDLVATRRLSSLVMVDCFYVVPSNGTKCDTVDLTGDGVVTLADIVAVRKMTSLVSYAPADLPWTLDTSSILASIVNSGAMQAAVTNSMGKGRPGIAVRFSVASGPATLSGREYNPPYDGIRDHASPPWATQVLAITQTDFPGDQSGATELTIPNVGTPVELTCTGDGTVTLNIDVMADTLKGIPAISVSQTVDCSIFPFNIIPVADAGSPQNVNTWDTVTLDGSASYDPDGSPITYSWSQVGGPRDVTLSDTAAVMATFDVTFEGTYTFELMVNDGQQYSFPVTTTVEATDQDFDDDGILDIWDADDDNDGVNDWTEIGQGYDPFDPNSYPPECMDGNDNDGDTITDYPDDPGCPTPQNTSELDAIVISAGYEHTCAITETGGMKCWGDNYYGEIGDGRISGYHTTLPVDVAGLASGVSAISAGGGMDPLYYSYGGAHTCAVTDYGSVKCWGNNSYGQFGNEPSVWWSPYPLDVSSLSNGIVEISAGGLHTCALTELGGVKCWGWNQYGQVGTGQSKIESTPLNVIGSNTASISMGWIHSCALSDTGGVKCWGNNSLAQIGNEPDAFYPPETNVYITPTNINSLTSGVSAISAGGAHTCALTDTGGVKCWGDNNDGQLGDNQSTGEFCFLRDPMGFGISYACCSTPVDVVGLSSGVVEISAGGFHTCALTETGGVKCWGANYYGQLGDGTNTYRHTPVDVVGLTSGVVSISAGGEHTCALMDTGSIKCWGNNIQGQIGDGTRMERSTPVDVVW